MKAQSKSRNKSRSTILQIAAELDGMLAAAVVAQVKRSLHNGSDTVVLDFSRTQNFSLAGLSVLIQHAAAAGVLHRLVCHTSDEWTRQVLEGACPISDVKPEYEGSEVTIAMRGIALAGNCQESYA